MLKQSGPHRSLPHALCPDVPTFLFTFFLARITLPRTYLLFFIVVCLYPLECEIREGRAPVYFISRVLE